MFVAPVGNEARGSAHDWTYFEVSDGTLIAASVRYPAGFDPAVDDPIPVLFQIDGYAAGGSGGINPASYGNNYITVYASIRGTGCSGGVFNLFDRIHAEDGHDIIVNHLPNLQGSNGKVGIIGHSYPGLTGWLVASTDPPNLEAIALSGLIDDLYRGIVYPGGVPNYGFPAVWTGAVRPGFELSGNAGRYIQETASGDPTCAANIAQRPTHTVELVNSVFENPVLRGGTSIEDGEWWQFRSTVTWVRGITKPTHMTQQYQDEQTGPRGANALFERISEDVPKRLVLTNGVHSTTSIGHHDRVAWLDCWILEDTNACDAVADPDERVLLHFETTAADVQTNPDTRPLPGEADYVTSDWPAPETVWTRYYLHSDGTMSTTPQSGDDPASYVSTTAGRQMTADAGFQLGNDGLGQLTFFDAGDQLRYELEVTGDDPLTIAGPINLTLTASSTATNTDFFVDLLDVAPDGRISYLQRGLQRASHREINFHPSRTDYTPGGDIYRAWHPHTNTTTKLLTPGQPEQFEVEIFPVGHVFRPGHKLVIQVHAPPPADPLSIYAWVSGQPPAVNTVYHDAVAGLAPSSILLPVLPATPDVDVANPPNCVNVIGVPCFTPVVPGLP